MISYQLVDVFTAQPGQGNLAGVVLQADGLDEATMQQLAARLGASETSFLCGSRLRYFTPACEVASCGHATLAAACAARIDSPTCYQTQAGEVTVRPETIGGTTVYWYCRPAPELQALERPAEPLLAALGHPRLDRELPLVVTADGDLLVPLHPYTEVEHLRPDPAALATAARAAGLRGVCALAVPGDTIHECRVRFFAPHLGVPEDPVTGSVHSAIAVYLHQMQIFEHFPEELRALSHQGDPAGRQGQVWLRLRIDPETDTPLVAEVGGEAVLVSTGIA
ncbi:MAG: PhzF family phenazine biosynthesis isomerase [Fimbriimonadaceae bacterium]|nr:PhzF family phenazine biosynthesis isomerase [Fimbriimonadaceae bacterium]